MDSCMKRGDTVVLKTINVPLFFSFLTGLRYSDPQACRRKIFEVSNDKRMGENEVRTCVFSNMKLF